MPPGERAEAMRRRVLRTAARAGAEPDLDLLDRAFAVGMAPRLDRALDDHHPDFLHPARTALILMDDAAVGEPVLLAAALVTETRDPGLAPASAARAALGPDVDQLAASVPVPEREGERLLEALLGAPREARLIATAERLDHARHLHLRDRAEWEAYHAITTAVYLPIAERTSAAITARLAWWGKTFERRFLAQ